MQTTSRQRQRQLGNQVDDRHLDLLPAISRQGAANGHVKCTSKDHLTFALSPRRRCRRLSLSPSRRCKNIFHHFSRKKRKIFAFPTHTHRDRELHRQKPLVNRPPSLLPLPLPLLLLLPCPCQRSCPRPRPRRTPCPCPCRYQTGSTSSKETRSK